jgi:Na+/melibiose symporter-like transporter
MASLKEKVAYALGDAAAGGIVWKVMSIAFPLFFTNVFGLSFADAAVLMLVARMFDVVTDPLMGSLADRTQSRFGTYRPWLIYCTFLGFRMYLVVAIDTSIETAILFILYLVNPIVEDVVFQHILHCFFQIFHIITFL